MDFKLWEIERPPDLEDLERVVEEEEEEEDELELELESAELACTGLVAIQNLRANKVSTFKASMRVNCKILKQNLDFFKL